jgi:hypothetical protein
MNIKYVNALAKNFKSGDGRLSYDVALTEAILNQVIVTLDNKGKIPKSRLHTSK